MHKILYLSLYLIFLSCTITAQSGKLRGKIIDGETGEELIGATVMVEGTSIGAAADLDGNFTINDLLPGTYDFTCQFISYNPQTTHNVEIVDGKVATIDFSLNSVSVGLQEVVVSAKAVNRSEAAMLTIQKKSANVVDGLSAEQISRSGDSDAAGALKRVSGVNVEGGKYVFVRGLSDRYSKTTLNGADIPGLDPNRNTVQMDIFPTSLIENMVVYKSYSPNLPANFTGGLIDIVTLDFPETFTVSFGAKVGINSQASFNNNFLSYQGSNTDFLGYDNGFRKIPNAAAGDIPVYPSGKQQLTDITTSFNKIMEPTTTPSAINNSYSFSIGNQYKIHNNYLGYVFGLSYKYNEKYFNNAIFANYTLGSSSDQKLITQYDYKAKQGEKEALWGALANVSYKIGRTNKISLNIFKNQSGTSQARYMIGRKPSDEIENLLIETRRLEWLQRGLTSAQLRGEHYFERLNKLKINWIGSVTKSTQKEPDLRSFTSSYYPDNEGKYKYAVEPSIYRVPARYYRNMQEFNYNFKADAVINLSRKVNSYKLKFGSAYSYKTRDFNEKRIDYKFQFSSNTFNGNISEFIADDNIGLNYPDYNPATGSNFGLYVQGNPGDDLKNSYSANQTIVAGYIMIDANITDKLRVATGVRLEQTTINSASKDSTLTVGYLNNTNFLPALNITWHITDAMNFRINISQTLARPSFRELAPYASENFDDGRIYVGNANLVSTSINNLDVRYEYYMKPGEIVSAGLFYKKFTNPIEVVSNPKAQNEELSWDNMNKAQVFGFELGIKKKIDFIGLLHNFAIGFNFTYVASEVSIDSLELAAIRATDPGAKDTRPMSGQSPYIVNASLGYHNTTHGLNIDAVFNVAGPKLVINVAGGTPDIYQQPFNSLNIVASKAVSKHFTISFTATNILNPYYKQTYTYKGDEYISRQYTKGSVFEVGLKYSFK